MTDITTIKRDLESRIRAVLEHLLPNGRIQGHEFHVGSIGGEAGSSLSIRLDGPKVGVWSDFAAGGESGDIIDLWMEVRKISLPEMLDQATAWLGINKPIFEREKRKSYRKPEKPKCRVPHFEVKEYLLNERKISNTSISIYQVGENGGVIVFPYMIEGTLTFVKYLPTDRKTGGKKPWIEADCEPVLFGWQAIPSNAREITIVEGEIDALTSYDYGFPALSVPFGGGKGDKQRWIENEFDRLSRFETIYIATDMDDEGNAAALEIIGRLGRHRCRRVLLPMKDLNECKKNDIPESEIRRVFHEAKTLDPAELKKPTDYAEQVRKLFWSDEDEHKGYHLPYSKISNLIRFRPAEFTIWMGPSGAGKSQILNDAMVDWGKQGAKICLSSLEMSPQQTLRRMAKQAANLERPSVAYLDAIMRWMDDWLWISAIVGKIELSKLLEIFDYARARYGCDMFVIDSLMRLGVGSEDYEGQERAVFALVTWAIEKNVHLHLVAHSRKADKNHKGSIDTEDIKGASEIGSNAFNILGIVRNKELEDKIAALSERVERGDMAAQIELSDIGNQATTYLRVTKQRNGDWEGKVGLWFNQKTYQYRCFEDSKDGRRYVQLD